MCVRLLVALGAQLGDLELRPEDYFDGGPILTVLGKLNVYVGTIGVVVQGSSSSDN